MICVLYNLVVSEDVLFGIVAIVFCLIVAFLMIKKTLLTKDNNIEQLDKEKLDIQKGKIGEEVIVNALEKIDIYHKIVRNVYITNDSRKTEIDIIYITTCGLFVIESKNFSGNIYGYDYDENWIQYFNQYKKYEFSNPILQNNYHIDFLCNKLNLAKKEYFKSYVIFGENARLKTINITKYFNTKVINVRNLYENIINDMHNSTILLSHEEIDKIYLELEYYCMHLRR